jgi:hypothetical protein
MWTKSQKISGAVLGLAAVAFCVDRFVLGSGDKAAAAASNEYAVTRSSSSSSSTPSVSPAAGPKKPAVVAAPVAAKSQPLTLASRLSAMAETRGFAYETVGDAFRPSEAWLAANRPPEPAKPAAVATGRDNTQGERVVPKIDYGSIFRAKHTLTAVMTKQHGGMAIVDGKTCKIGQSLDGFRLTKLGINEATFVGSDAQVTLRLPEPTLAETR